MQSAMKHRIETIFTNPRIFWFTGLLGLLIALPSLSSGLFLDDYFQRIILLTKENISPFDFLRMGTAQADASLQSGLVAWWTHPASRLAFFRPIAQGLMQLDYWLWPNSVPLMHLHSILWYAALVLVAGFVYRRLMPLPLAAGFAAVLFAIDVEHSGGVAWLADRNVLVAMTGSMLALLYYDREQWYWRLLSCVFFALTLASAEAALAITGYFFAYEVFLAKQRWSLRILRLLPYAFIAVLWLAFWHYRGYGSAGPGFYTDPTSDPGAFLRGMIFRAPSLLFGQFSLFPIEFLGMFEKSPWRLHTLVLVLIVCGIILRFLWPLLQSSALARFYALGMCLATVPICGAQLLSRSLCYVGFGAIGLLALLFERFFLAQVKPQKSLTLFVGSMLVLHFAVSPLSFLIVEATLPWLDKRADSHAIHLPDDEGNNKNVLAVSSLNYPGSFFFPLMKDKALSLGATPLRPPPSIAKVLALTSGYGEFELWREDSDTLVVRREDGFTEMRKGKYGFVKGERVMLNDVAITVREVTADRAATEIEYRFKPGVLNTYEVIAWQGDHFSPTKLPVAGTKTIVGVSLL